MGENSLSEHDLFIRHMIIKKSARNIENPRPGPSFLQFDKAPYSMYLLRSINEIGDLEGFLRDLKPVKNSERSIEDYAVFGIMYRKLKLLSDIEIKFEKDDDGESRFRNAHYNLYLSPSLTKTKWGDVRGFLLAGFIEVWPNNKVEI